MAAGSCWPNSDDGCLHRSHARHGRSRPRVSSFVSRHRLGADECSRLASAQACLGCTHGLPGSRMRPPSGRSAIARVLARLLVLYVVCDVYVVCVVWRCPRVPHSVFLQSQLQCFPYPPPLCLPGGVFTPGPRLPKRLPRARGCGSRAAMFFCISELAVLPCMSQPLLGNCRCRA